MKIRALAFCLIASLLTACGGGGASSSTPSARLQAPDPQGETGTSTPPVSAGTPTPGQPTTVAEGAPEEPATPPARAALPPPPAAQSNPGGQWFPGEPVLPDAEPNDGPVGAQGPTDAPGVLPAVPEPETVVMFTMIALAGGFLAWRHRRTCAA